MKRLLILFLVVLIGVVVIPGTEAQQPGISKKGKEVGPVTSAAGSRLTLNPNFGKVPLYFIPNKGQVNEKAKFYAKTSRYTLWMATEGLVFDSVRKVEEGRQTTEGRRQMTDFRLKGTGKVLTSPEGGTPRPRRGHPLRGHPSQEGNIERDVSRLVFLDVNKNTEMVPLEITRHKVNYFIGNDPNKWQKGITTSKAVLYKDIYKNIDLKVYGNESQIEYDWIIKPGGNPAAIRFEYKNVKGTRIDKKGNLLIETKFGKLLHKKPVSSQMINGEKVYVESDFKRVDKNTYGFKVHEFSKDYELIIDPVVSLEYSTYLGGSDDELYTRMFVDELGQVHLTGYTYSYDYPIKNAYQGSQASSSLDAILTKFDSSGSDLIFSTYFGGSSSEYFFGITVAGNGDVFIAGDTFSSDLPGINSCIGGKDVFIARFDSSGNFLCGRYLGGTDEDRNLDIILDSSNHLWVTGFTSSTDFPTKNPYQYWSGGYCAYVSKLTSDLSIIKYSTYLGGSGEDIANRIVIDNSGCFYVTGRTSSSDFPVKNAWQNNYGGGQYDLFLTKFKPDGSELVFSTYLGGSGDEYYMSLALGNSGSVYIGGFTDSTDFPTKNPYQETNRGDYDIVISKFSPDGSQLLYSTYLGGTGEDWHGVLTLDNSGYIYITGSTYSDDFPTKAPYQSTYRGSRDAFFSILSPEGTDLIYSTFFGGSGWERCLNIAKDSSGNIYLAGETGSWDLPVLNAYQFTMGGAHDFFVARFSIGWNLTAQSTPNPGVPIAVTPNDTNGNGDGNTNFTRTYPHGETVTLTAPGTYKQKVFYKWNIDGVENLNRTIQVVMNRDYTVTADYQTPGELSLSRSQLYFGANTSGAATGDQTFFISKSGENTLNWTVSDNASWLTCSPTSGTNSGEVTVLVDASGLAAGTYYGTITVSALNVSNSPQYVNVALVVYKVNTTGVPFGYFETPKDGAYVYGSIPVTGWALDDIEVEHVKIYRKEGKDLVYIGDAVFVDGARPDVELAYPNYPKSYRAGWGYMMLTNFLPNGGNGIFTLYAIAKDKEGNHVTLGTKTIECDNANAVRPFGAIDTPAQGGTASGTNHRNQGWVLTPLPNKIPEDGHTIIVWIDGIDVGKCKYNIYRSDIASLFPGYANSSGAMAYFDFDTTTYDNGVHTIQWTAVDNAGNVDGIGSRYFTIQNTGGSADRTAQGADGKVAAFNVQSSMFNLNPSEVPMDYSSPIRVKKGYNQNIKPHKQFPDENGNITIEIKELEQIELQLSEGTRGLAPLSNAPLPDFPGLPFNNWKGFLVVGNRLRTLPIGSTFNSQEGIFCWQPGPGFINTYQLVFFKAEEKGKLSKKLITVNILPKFGREQILRSKK